MNILYLSVLDGRPWGGPTYSVPSQVEAQAKVDHVLWYNQEDRTATKWKETMQAWSEKPYYRDLHDYPQRSLSALPAPFSKPDLVIFEQLYKFKRQRIRREVERSGIPYIVIPRGEATAKAQRQKALKKKIGNALIFGPFMKKAAAVQYLTDLEARDSGAGWNARSLVLPNGTDPCEPFEKPAHDGIRCLSIGRLAVYHKGLDLLTEACGRIREEMLAAGCTVDVYGPDREGKKEELEAQAREKGIDGILRFHDGLYGEEKAARMREYDVFLMTSRFEGHPTALLDALAMGMPAMVTAGSNMLPEIREADAGWTAEGSVESIQQMILTMIREKDSLAQKGRNALQLSRKYNWDAIAERGHQLYLELLG